MQALKTVVIVLGALIVGGFGVLIYGLTHNWHKLSDAPATVAAAPATQPASSARTAVAAWGKVALGQPPDSRIQSVTRAGRLIVVQVTAGTAERLLVLDPATGAVVGTFALTDQP